MKQQLEGGQSTANAEVEHLRSQLQQLTATVETQKQRYSCTHDVVVCVQYLLYISSWDT